MRCNVDGSRYTTIPWTDLLCLAEDSPTGLRWKNASGVNGVKAGDPAGTIVEVSPKPGRNRSAYTQMYISYKGKRYSTRVLIKLLKGESVPFKVVVNPSEFNQHNSEWIQNNPNLVWAAILRILKTPGMRARLHHVNLINSNTGEFDQDLLQDIFSDACRAFNRSYRIELGIKETTYMWDCTRSAIQKNLDRAANHQRHVVLAIHDEDGTSIVDTHPAKQVGVADLIETEHKAAVLSNVHAAAKELFKRNRKGIIGEKVYNLSMKGLNLRQIGQRIGMSYERVRQYRDWYTQELKISMIAKGVHYAAV